MAAILQIFLELVCFVLISNGAPLTSDSGAMAGGGAGVDYGSGAIFHQNQFQHQQQLLNGNNIGPASMQYMAMNHDGQYSFAYSGADSSRQERRHGDGSVVGQYSYTDPHGKLVEVGYTADALNGYKAYGNNIPVAGHGHGQQLGQHLSNSVVEDTLAVREARERFFETYARELARVNAVHTGAVVVNEAVPAPIPVVPVPVEVDPVPVQAQTVAVSTPNIAAKNPIPSPASAATSVVATSTQVKDAAPSAAVAPVPVQDTKIYSVAGFDSNNYQHPGQFVGIQPQPQPQPQRVVSEYADHSYGVGNKGPAYFYYVGVGGMPYYVTSPVRNTNIAVSVRASEAGAIPADAVHDAQIPRYGPHTYVSNPSRPSPPVYVEMGKDYTVPVTNFAGTSINSNSQSQSPHVTYHQTHSTSSQTGRTMTASTSSTSGQLPGSGSRNQMTQVRTMTAPPPPPQGLHNGFGEPTMDIRRYQVPYYRFPYYGNFGYPYMF